MGKINVMDHLDFHDFILFLLDPAVPSSTPSHESVFLCVWLFFRHSQDKNGKQELLTSTVRALLCSILNHFCLSLSAGTGTPRLYASTCGFLPRDGESHMCIGRKAVAVNNHQHGTGSVWKDWVCTLPPSNTSGMKKNIDLRKDLSANCRARPSPKSNNLQNWLLLSLNRSTSDWETVGLGLLGS